MVFFKRLFIWLLITVSALYIMAYTLLSTSFVQRKVLSEITSILKNYGIIINISSANLSFLSPKIYLNGVSITTTKKALINLEQPLNIEKIRIEFSPIGLILNNIIIDDFCLIHPKVFLPDADTFYEKIKKSFRKISLLKGESKFTLVLRKFTIIDADVNATLKSKEIILKTPSFSIELENTQNGQISTTINSKNLHIWRKNNSFSFNQFQFDFDFLLKSIRVNSLKIKGENLSIDIRGTASLERYLKPINVSYDIKIPLNLVNDIEEFNSPIFKGWIETRGTIEENNNEYTGKGEISYYDLSIDGYEIGAGSSLFHFEKNSCVFSKLRLNYGDGKLTSDKLTVELNKPFRIFGDLNINGLSLSGLLRNLKSPNSNVSMLINGTMNISGQLSNPFEIKSIIKSDFSNFKVVDNELDTILNLGNGTSSGSLTFDSNRFSFDIAYSLLGAEGNASGFITYDTQVEIQSSMKSLSLSSLNSIGTLHVGGKLDGEALITVINDDVNVKANISVNDAEISELILGDIKGIIFYSNLLLSFENLKIESLEPIKGHGIIDFSPDKTHYKFNVDIKRSPVEQVISVFKKYHFGFSLPKKGEISAELDIEGPYDQKKTRVLSVGKGFNVEWYGEKWNGVNFIFELTDKNFEIPKLLLFKERGALAISGNSEQETKLTFKSEGIFIEEFDAFKKIPFRGKIEGSVNLVFDKKSELTDINGQLSLNNMFFRSTPLNESYIVLTTSNNKTIQIRGSLNGKSGELMIEKNKSLASISYNFTRFNMLPIISYLLNKDLYTIDSLLISGGGVLKYDLTNLKLISWNSLFSYMEIEFKDSSIINESPISIKLKNNHFEIGTINLSNIDTKIDFKLSQSKGGFWNISLDAAIDLKYLEPFLYIFDYGNGKLFASLRLYGPFNSFNLTGNMRLSNGILRLSDLKDEFKEIYFEANINEKKIEIVKFDSEVNGGQLSITGYITINRFKSFEPNIKIDANRVKLGFGDYLNTNFSGNFSLLGYKPYKLSGNCLINEAELIKLESPKNNNIENGDKDLTFDIQCKARNKLFVNTPLFRGEFKGLFHVLGDKQNIGLIGQAECINGNMLFRKTKFDIESAYVKFESPDKISPRFKIVASSTIKEKRSTIPEEYQIKLQAFGLPDDYKLHLSSSPPLSENDIASLLLFGYVTRNEERGSYLDLGAAIMGNLPFESKIEDKLGFNIKLQSEEIKHEASASIGVADSSVTAVQIKKKLGENTTVSFTNTLESVPARELRLERMIDENLSVSASAAIGNPGSTENELRRSYGLDFRYRFNFE